MGRGHAAHLVLLQAAHDQRADVVLVQEPWVGRDPARRQTKHHPAYTTMCAWSDWEIRPRAIAYVRTDRRGMACAEDPLIPPHPDVVALQICVGQSGTIRVVGVYNPPAGCERYGEPLELLRTAPEWTGRTLWVRDFNARHGPWEATPHRRVSNGSRPQAH